MIKKLNKVLLVLLTVGLALYIVQYNKEAIVFRLSNETFISATGGVIYIGIFIAGFILASLGTLFFGFKAYFRERKYKSQERMQLAFIESQMTARSHLASHQWKKARESWEKILKRDPKNIIARVELSRSLQGEGRLKEALQTLDSARAKAPENIEVLFRAAELNLALGNKTAAVDNLALVLYHNPNLRAAEMARDLSIELGRIEDAIEYQSTLNSLDYDSGLAKDAALELEYRRIMQNIKDKEELTQRIRSFIRKNSSFAPALKTLAELELGLGNIDTAAKHYVAAAKTEDHLECWHLATRLWIENNMPDRALAAARYAAKHAEGHSRLTAELNLIRLCLELGMYDEAETSIEQFPELIKSMKLDAFQEEEHELLILKGLCLSGKGMNQEAKEVWKQLGELSTYLQEQKTMDKKVVGGEAPAPRLSTP